MALQSGTATDYLDLLDQIKTALTNPAFLGTEIWTVKRWQNSDPTHIASENELILVGSGLAGDDEIYIGVSGYFNAAGDYYNWRLNGFTAYSAGQDFDSQPGAILRSDYPPALPLWNSPITYWLVANGRRIILVTKVSTRFEALYLGFIQPYATPGQFPYPIVVGGSITGYNANRWSYDGNEHRHFVDPKIEGSSVLGSLRFRNPSGAWESVLNNSGDLHTFPFYPGASKVAKNLDGSYLLLPIVVHDKSSGYNAYGELECCYWLTGMDNSAENIVTISGQDYLVVQDVYRTGVEDYWALKLA